MQRIVIGRIVKPQGIRGELKVVPLTDDAQRFSEIKNIFLKGVGYDVINARVSSNGIFLQLKGIVDRDQAEALRNCEVEIDRLDAKVLDKDENFVVDVIGCAVFVGDDKFGKLKDILQLGSADVYVIETPEKLVAMVPSIKRLVLSVDVKNRQIKLDKTAFEDLVVYED